MQFLIYLHINYSSVEGDFFQKTKCNLPSEPGTVNLRHKHMLTQLHRFENYRLHSLNVPLMQSEKDVLHRFC